MRTLASPQQTPKRSVPNTPKATGSPAAESAPLPAASASSASAAATATPHASPAPGASCLTPQQQSTSCSSQPVIGSTPNIPSVIEENTKLKDSIKILEKRVDVILNHSIESDTRLLEFTNEIFPENRSSISQTNEGAVSRDCGVQCDPPADCRNSLCVENLALITRLKTSIGVLEEEIKFLKSQNVSPNLPLEASSDFSNEAWNVMGKKNHPLTTKNRYGCLTSKEENVETKSNPSKQQQKRKRNNRQKNKSVNKSTNETLKSRPPHSDAPATQALFQSILLESDSHGRHMAPLLQRVVPSNTKVCVFVKGGAKLREVTSGSPLPSGTCSIIIAGTNDVAAGEQNNIFKHLEGRVVERLKTSKVVLSTLPHRHDLPARDPVNKQIIVINRYIRELCDRYAGLQMFNFNEISRRFFTRHGMHLNMQGKELLATLLSKAVIRAGKSESPPPARPPTPTTAPSVPAQTPTDAPAEPIVLPYETFADAVKGIPADNGTPPSSNINISAAVRSSPAPSPCASDAPSTHAAEPTSFSASSTSLQRADENTSTQPTTTAACHRPDDVVTVNGPRTPKNLKSPTHISPTG